MLAQEIMESLASASYNTAIEIKAIKPHLAWVAKESDKYGVFIPYENSIDIYEVFSGIQLESTEVTISNKNHRVLYLHSKNKALRLEFSMIAAHFVDPGPNGEARSALNLNPQDWVNNWSSLLGNSFRKKSVSSLLGELIILDHLYHTDKDVVWTGKSKGTHDIESTTANYEVKSTILRYDSLISISSHHQLESDLPLYLFFVRFEKSKSGVSLSKVLDSLLSNGYSTEIIDIVTKFGYSELKSEYKETYKVLEIRKYVIDENFPKILMEDLQELDKSNCIVKVQYTIDLNGLQYQSVDFNNK